MISLFGTKNFWKLIKMANYLDVQGFLDVTRKRVARTIKGETPEGVSRPPISKMTFPGGSPGMQREAAV